MRQLFETTEPMRDRHQREFASLRKTYRRDQLKLFGFLSVWLAFILYLYFAPSHEVVLIAFSIYTLAISTFIASLFRK